MEFKKFPKQPDYWKRSHYERRMEEWRVDTAEKLEKMIEDYKDHGELRYSAIELMKQLLESLKP